MTAAKSPSPPSPMATSYAEAELHLLDRKMAAFLALPPADRDLIPELPLRLKAVSECIEANARLFRDIEAAGAASGAKDIGTANTDVDDPESAALSLVDMRVMLAMLMSEWTAEGATERSMTHTPILDAIEAAYAEAARAVWSLPRDKFRVLVPAARTGRLAWELVVRGFAVEGCETDAQALLACNYALNIASRNAPREMYPFVHDSTNVRSAAAQIRACLIPDVDPKTVSAGAEFGMRAGDFVDAYEGLDNSWDAIASCFALDLCSEDCVSFAQRAALTLKPGGAWVFLGPLPAPVDQEMLGSLYLSMEEFLKVVRKCGFKIIRKEKLQCSLGQNPLSLRSVSVECTLFVAIKIRPTGSGTFDN